MIRTIRERAGAVLSSEKARILIDLALLAAVLWVAHFWYFRSFGLYEDDYTHISPALAWDLPQLLENLKVFVTWPLGRPLGLFLNFSLAFIGGKLGGLSMIYILNYMTQVTNAFLFYLLLRRIGHDEIAWVGASILGLFPAITTHIFLMHAVGEEYTSLMFLLIASHCYLSGRKMLAYLLSLACLLTYETPYAVFLAVPLLLEPWDKRLFRAILRHAVLWLCILVAVVAIRALIGEARIAGEASSISDGPGVFRAILSSMLVGPAVALSAFVSGPAWTLSQWERKLTLVVLACIPVFAFMLYRMAPGLARRESGRPLQPGTRSVESRIGR